MKALEYLSIPKMWRMWQLRRELSAQRQKASENMFTSITAPSKLANNQQLTDDDRLYWVKRFLSQGADPNFVGLPNRFVMDDARHYPSLNGKRSALSLAVFYPEITKALIEAGARFDLCAMEGALYLINLNHTKKRENPSHHWNMEPIARAVEALFSAKVISAPLHRKYVDNQSMKICPAYEILAQLYPGARAYVEARELDRKTPDADQALPTVNRL